MTQVTKKENNTKKRRSFPFVFLGRLTRNSIFLLLLICVLLFLLYLVGNYQGFIDKSQLRILTVLSVASAALCVMSVLGFIQEAVFIFFREKKFSSILSMLFFIFSFSAGFAMIAFSAVIKRISTGI